MSAWTGQAADDFPDRNQLAAFALHGSILPCSSDKTGTPTSSRAPPRLQEKERNYSDKGPLGSQPLGQEGPIWCCLHSCLNSILIDQSILSGK